MIWWRFLLKKIRWKIKIDIIVAMGGFSALLIDPLKNEYMYKKVAEAHNTTHEMDSCANSTTEEDILVNQEVSRLTLLMCLAMFIPACIAGVLLMSWSDRVGRKKAMVVPLVGMILSGAWLAVSIKLNWQLRSLYVYSLLAGAGGYYMTLLMQGNAYLSDITPKEKRGVRFVTLETFLGLAGGIAGVSGGFWVDASGFYAPVAFSVILNIVALTFVPLLPDSTKIREKRNKEEEKRNEINSHFADEFPPVFDRSHDDDDVTIRKREEALSTVSLSSAYGSTDNNNISDSSKSKKKYTSLGLLKAVWNVYSSEYSRCEECHENVGDISSVSERCPHGGGRYPGRKWRMWSYLASYDAYMFVVVGTMIFQTIFYLSKPLCFTPVLVGAQLGLKFIGVAFSPFLVIFLHRTLNFSNTLIILIGFAFLMAFCIIMSFATQPYIVFIATAMTIFANPSKPLIQAQMSSLVSEYEQGAAFALLSFSEILTFLVATVSFLTLYPATVAIYHGFAWLVAAGIVLLPLFLMTVVYIGDKKRERNEEQEPLITS